MKIKIAQENAFRFEGVMLKKKKKKNELRLSEVGSVRLAESTGGRVRCCACQLGCWEVGGIGSPQGCWLPPEQADCETTTSYSDLHSTLSV
jgi:hypothetical protein